jgi:hypothetical protein
MKKAWILKLIVICSFALLGERLSISPDFKSSTSTFLHETSDHSDVIVAIELEDEVEEEALSLFSLPSTFDWKAKLFFFFLFFALILNVQRAQTKTPAFLRFQNLRL